MDNNNNDYSNKLFKKSDNDILASSNASAYVNLEKIS
jgi:hypothetical protein